jgi:hypothetical protein
MKKLTLLVSMLTLGGATFGQSQRLTLAEEFTQASCGPCAAANPAFNSLVDANQGKIVTIKYQTDWPGTDPMNTQNPSEVATRVTYYGVTGVPNVNYDGTVVNNGDPSAVTQTKINTEYAVASPFTINLSHSFSADLDSVFITMDITCSQNITGALKAHVALVEREIHFTTAPGTNGEKDFYSVMRKMFPNASGTTLATSWTTGQTQTLTFSGPVPSYIYNMNELAVVAFIQNNTTKSVKQAALSAPIALPASTEDAGISASVVPAVQCVTTVTPSVTIKNYSANTLTNCTINYSLDGGAVMTQSWNGSLAQSASNSVALPTLNTTIGSHTLVTYTSFPNGNNDYYLNNNTNTKRFVTVSNPAAAPLAQDFTSSVFPPANWAVNNTDGLYTWSRATNAGGFSTGGESAKMDFFNSPSGQIDEIFLEALDLTTSNTAATMTFDVAYAQYSTQNDKLQVMVSTNCGTSWVALYTKQGSTLMTASPTTSAFIPTSTQWRTETVNLTSYLNKPNLLVKLRATSNYGNNLYIDNINIETSMATGVNEVSSIANSLNVYPNPFTNEATVEFALAESDIVNITMHNVLGETVSSTVYGSMNTGEHSIKLDGSNLDAGIYFITLNAGQNKITKKVIINK